MTTIVWDGKILAADGRATYSSGLIVSTDAVKIFKGKAGMCIKGEQVIAWAMAGNFSTVDLIEEWLLDGADFDTEFPEDAGFQVLVVTEEHAYSSYDEAFGWIPHHNSGVLGSGTDAALSALAFGKNAIEAVQHAMKLDTGTGGTIRYMNCRDGKHVLKSL